MKKRVSFGKLLITFVLVLTVFSAAAQASQDDNSLYSLGIITEGVTVEPEFTYSTWEYNVTVPGGTKVLELDPVPSSDAARIADITGTELDADGNGTVLITVEAGDGSRFTYTLHVVSDGTAAPETETETATEAPTEPETEAPTEPETEDTRYVRVDRNTIEEAENTITSLKNEITEYRNTINLYMRIMFGLIGLAVILLFLVINLLIRKKDLKAELKEYRSLGYGVKGSKKAQKKAQKAQKAQKGQKAAPAGNAQEADPRKKNRQMPAYEQTGVRPTGQLPQNTAQRPQMSRQQLEEQAARAAAARAQQRQQTGQIPQQRQQTGQIPQQTKQIPQPAAQQQQPTQQPQQTPQTPQQAASAPQQQQQPTPQQPQAAPAPQAPQQPQVPQQAAPAPQEPQQTEAVKGRGKKSGKDIQINMIDL